MSKIKPVSQAIHTKTRRPKEWLPIKGSPGAYQMDLLFLNSYSRENQGFKGILNIINIPSRFMYCFPFKNKSDASDLIEKWLDMDGGSDFCRENRPAFLESDAGLEFVNARLKKILEERGVSQFTSTNGLYVGLVERSNRTLREILEKHFSAVGNLKWVEFLGEATRVYNAGINRTTHIAPIDFTMADYNRMNAIYKTITDTLSHKISRLFKPGQSVIVRKPKNIFEKGATPGWERTLHTIVKFIPPKSYLLDNGQTVAYNNVLLAKADSSMEPPRAQAKTQQKVDRIVKQLS